MDNGLTTQSSSKTRFAPKNGINKNDFTIRLMDKSVGKEIVRRFHYLKNDKTLMTYVFGVFRKTPEFHLMFPEGELVGVAVYGNPVGRSAHVRFGIQSNEMIELKRLFISDEIGQNIESFVISKTIDWLKRNDRKIKIVYSQSDPSETHSGTIYYASGFLFEQRRSENVFETTFSIGINGPSDWICSRNLGTYFKSKSVSGLRKEIGKTFWVKWDVQKLRFVFPVIDETKKRFERNPSLTSDRTKIPHEKCYKCMVEKIEV